MIWIELNALIEMPRFVIMFFGDIGSAVCLNIS